MQLPALQTMEQLLFELVWVGVILLSASIITGILFLEDMFAQHLAHKPSCQLSPGHFFSVAGRPLPAGLARTIAIRWAIGGYILLMLAFFGSKLVLELVLGS